MFVTGLLTLQTMFVGAGSLGGIIHVPVDEPTIQSAIDAAQPLDTIIVEPGTYRETINLLAKAITLRSSGGAEVTTIDATGLNGSVVTCSSGEGPDTVLDGFTITGGTGTSIGGNVVGGGMLNYSSSPTVTNCTFSVNTAKYGGGMYNDSGSPTVTNCTFSGNRLITGGGGGGMFNYASASPTVMNCTFNGNAGNGMSNDAGSPTVTNCTFSGNAGRGMSNGGGSPTVTNCTFSGNTGGGMSNYSGSPTVTNCTFSGNDAYNYGGGMRNDYGSPTVTNCTFNANTATLTGGGMFSGGGNTTVTNCTFSGNAAGEGGGMYNGGGGNPAVSDCTFSGNTAGYGGGMYNVFSNPKVTNCTFTGNTAGNYGGGMYNNQSSPTGNNCAFSGNAAYLGGGMYNNGSSPKVINCAFSGNTADLYGGGMYNNKSYTTTRNCTFSANTATSGGGMYNTEPSNPTVTNSIFWGDSPNEIVIGLSATTIRFSDIHGGFPVGAINGGGNIYVNPMFTRPPDPGPDGTWDGVEDDYGDLRLQAGSPCINAGDPAFVAQPGETDLDMNPRVVGTAVDMGAFEFQGEPQNDGPDFDEDGIPDIHDFDIDGDGIPNTIDECDYTPLGITIDGSGRPLADINRDCTVDLRDYAIFQNSIFGP